MSTVAEAAQVNCPGLDAAMAFEQQRTGTAHAAISAQQRSVSVTAATLASQEHHPCR